MGEIKRMCDWPGCKEWGVASVTAEFVGGGSQQRIACQVHLDALMQDAAEQTIPIDDDRKPDVR